MTRPTPEMIAAGWEVVNAAKERAGITRLGAGVGVVEIYMAMQAAAPASKIDVDVKEDLS